MVGFCVHIPHRQPFMERFRRISTSYQGIRRILPIGVSQDESLWYLLSISRFLERRIARCVICWGGVWWHKRSIHTVTNTDNERFCFYVVLAVCHFRVFPVYGGAYLYDGIHILVYYLGEVHNDYQIYPSVDMPKYWYAIITPNRTTPNMANPIAITTRFVMISFFSLVPFIEFLRVSL